MNNKYTILNFKDNICIGIGEAETYLAARDRVYPTETRGTWLSLERSGQDDEADDSLGGDDRDHGKLTDGRPIPWEIGRWPTPVTVNAQTKTSEVNLSLIIR